MASVLEIEEAQLTCQTFGHRWGEVKGDLAEHGFRHLVGYRILMQCDRCYKMREDIVSRSTGGLVSRRYISPPKWQKVDNAGYGRSSFRLELLRRRHELEQPPLKKD